MPNSIRLRDIRVNNLDIRKLDIETGLFHVFCGPSGSGKSSLAFDMIYATADAKGCARGLGRVYRKTAAQGTVDGLPRCVIGIEQQLTHQGMVESVAAHAEMLPLLAAQAGTRATPCPTCSGRGYLRDIDPERVLRAPDKPVTNGAFTPEVKKCVGLDTARWRAICMQYGVSPALPWNKLPAALRRLVLHEGHAPLKPVIPTLREQIRKPPSGPLAEELPYYTHFPRCPQCSGWGFLEGGTALRETLTLGQVRDLDPEAREWLERLDLIAIPLLAPLFRQSSSTARKLRFFAALRGLEPRSLVLFDEPAAGLMSAEARAMATALRALQQKGHTVIAVEHMPQVIEAADMVTAFGPGAGADGGRIVFHGAPAAYPQKQPAPARRKSAPRAPEHMLTARFSSWFGFSGMHVAIPLLRVVCVSGPSGSGKTAYVEAAFAACDKTPTAWQGRTKLAERNGHERIRRPHSITPDPIGVHAGSTPATYTGLWDAVRELFASMPESRRLKLGKTHFSFNMPKGRCPECKGRGFQSADGVHFDTCPTCKGTRYREKVLHPQYKGRSIAAINALTTQQALKHFKDIEQLARHLGHYVQVALEYLVLGQPSNTLSGGENLRVKIVDLLSKRLGDRSLYILDNPCRGIGHPATSLLINSLLKLSHSHTVLVAENDPEMMRQADWLILLSPPTVRKDGTRTLNITYAGPPNRCREKF